VHAHLLCVNAKRDDPFRYHYSPHWYLFQERIDEIEGEEKAEGGKPISSFVNRGRHSCPQKEPGRELLMHFRVGSGCLHLIDGYRVCRSAKPFTPVGIQYLNSGNEFSCGNFFVCPEISVWSESKQFNSLKGCSSHNLVRTSNINL
jgi:hypothetical protein